MSNIGLIDWWGLGFGVLIVLGLAIVLTALGWAYYYAQVDRRSFLTEWRSPSYQWVSAVGLAVFSAGMTGSSEITWERIAWLMLALAFSYQAWSTKRSQASAKDSS